ncbi:hypothetical protein Rhopal_000142-T1 [Rhodotorula paludigena]|uniref:Non-structural maintenance of chromosomes element 1 homolog n=1 Tax=Rhodotorula paludigena TaxID=86838 RepID=A0AAV5GD02_9BASI|nr:hypothetical protein Rhopal_000142-T1 [Rhodotorula paludigena]
MAPRASTSKQRAASPAGSSSGSEGGGAPRGNGKQQQDGDDELDHDAELDALELKDPLRTCRHLFLQALIARKTLPLDRAKALYQECVRLCNVEDPDSIETFVAGMEPGLSLCGLDIKTTRDQESGTGMYILVNTIQDEPAKIATEYKAEEIAFFKAVVEKIMLAPRASYSISQTDAVRCAKAPLTKTVAIQLIKSLLAKGWLSLHSSGRLLLSPRSLVELAPYLRETFGGDDEDVDDGVVVDCNDCLTIVTSRRLGANGQCPAHLDKDLANPCTQLWPKDATTRKFHGTPIGPAALAAAGDDEDDDDDVLRGTSDQEGTSPAVGRKGKGGRKSGGAKKGKGKKRARDDDEEDEEDELDEDDDDSARKQSSVSPAATRKSSRTTQKKRIVAPDDDDDDEEDAED